MRNFPQHLKTFFELYDRDEVIELYNEFSVYYRLGNHLEKIFTLDYKVQFMRPPEYFGISEPLVKSNLDIAIFDDDMTVRHAIEVVYIKDEPQLEKMFEICTGLKFMEQMVEHGWQHSYVLLLADLPPQEGDLPHYLFRGETILEGMMQQPTDGDAVIDLRGSYTIEWEKVDNSLHYAVIPVYFN